MWNATKNGEMKEATKQDGGRKKVSPNNFKWMAVYLCGAHTIPNYKVESNL